jgi:hypothetical protein
MGQGGTRHLTISSNATETRVGTTTSTPLILTTNDTTRLTIAASTGAATFSSSVTATSGIFSSGTNDNILGGGALGMLNYSAYNSSADQSITLGLGIVEAVNNNVAYRYILGVGGNASGQNLTLSSNRRGSSDLTILTVNGTNGAATFASTISGTSLRSSGVGTFGFNTANNGEFQIYATAADGMIMAGRGSTHDMVITNKSGQDIFRIPTGTTNANFVGNVGIGTSTPNTIDTTAGARSGMESAIGSIGLNLTRGGENSVMVLQGGTYTNTKTAKIALLGGFGDGGGRVEGFTIESKASGTSGNITNNFIISSISSAGANVRMNISPDGTVAFNGSSTPNSGGLDKLSLGFADGAYGWVQTWSGRPLTLNSQGNNVLIGTTTDLGYRLQVAGTIYQSQYTYYGNNVAGNLSGATWINTGVTLAANNLGTYEVYVLGNENNQNQCLRIYYVYYNTNIGWTALLASTHIQPTGNEYGVVNLRVTSGGVLEVQAYNSVSGGLYRIVVTKQFQN